MPKRKPLFLRHRLLLVEPLERRELLSVSTWTGAGSDDKWSTAANWSPAAAPSAGADLVFPSSVTGTSINNNLSVGTSFNSVTFSGSGYTIDGNNIVVTGSVSADAGTSNTINVAMMLDGSVAFNIDVTRGIKVPSTEFDKLE